MEDNNNEHHKEMPGLYVPPEVYLNPELTQTEMFLFSLLKNLCNTSKGCWASNHYLSTRLFHCTDQTITNSLAKLRKYQYININYKNHSETGNKKAYTERQVFINTNYQTLYFPLIVAYTENVDVLSKKDLEILQINTIKIIIGDHVESYDNKNNINEKKYKISSNNKLLEEKKDFDKSSSSHPLKTRNKISLQKESIRNSYSKESLAPPSKVIKEPIITEDVKLIMDYWMECKLHMPKKETKSYINSINSIKNLLSGKTFGVKYTIEEIKQSIDNFANSAYNPECEPLSIDKKKKLQSLPIGDFIRSYQGYSYFEDYLKKSPKTLIEDKFPEITKSLKKIYSEEVFGTVNKTYETEQENTFRKASKKLKQFISENITRWNDYMVPKTDYDEAMLLWASIKYDFMGSDNFSCVTPNWLISNKTFEHRLPAFLFHQGYLTDESDKSKTSTFSDRSKIYSDSKSDCEYWQALLYD